MTLPVPRIVTFLALTALLTILGMAVLPIIAVGQRAGGGGAILTADLAALRFTLLQAFLSALVSIALAIPLARALVRRRFPGHGLLITILGAPFILPVIAAILGLLAIFGRAGAANQVLGFLGLPPISIFGLQGVVLAHVFFNMPLATRLLLQGWASVPAERLRLAAALNFSSRDIFRHLEWPMLRTFAPRAFLLIFLICLTSFAVALTLGGGPGATTVELAIYQAFSFDFELGRAARLALIQLGLGAFAGLAALAVTLPGAFGASLDRHPSRWDGQRATTRFLDGTAILIAMLFLLPPLIAVALRGLPNLAALEPIVLMSALRSLVVALTSVAIMLVLVVPLAIWAARGRAALTEGVGLTMLATSPLVLGTGLFLIVFPYVDPAAVALPVTALVNAAATLPFALRALIPAVDRAERDFGRLSLALAMPPGARIRRVILPRIRGPLGFACALTAALSMGDLGVIVLFSGSDAPTLPLMIYRLMGAYRMDDAAAAALLLLTLSFALFALFDLWGRRDA